MSKLDICIVKLTVPVLCLMSVILENVTEKGQSPLCLCKFMNNIYRIIDYPELEGTHWKSWTQWSLYLVQKKRKKWKSFSAHICYTQRISLNNRRIVIMMSAWQITGSFDKLSPPRLKGTYFWPLHLQNIFVLGHFLGDSNKPVSLCPTTAAFEN